MCDLSNSASFRKTKYACYVGYITQAIINNLAPLLFVTFQRQFHISLEQLSFIIALNFCVQIGMDLFSALFVDRIGYRASVILAHAFSSVGLCMMSLLPFFLDAYAGLVISMFFSAMGGGLLEAVISPIVEAIPTDKKKSQMALLHSFYCWGQMGVVLLSTVYFFLTGGTSYWRILPLLWALVPFANLLFFLRVPIVALAPAQKSVSIATVCRKRFFWLCMVLMLCAGSVELSMSQWSSLFAETGLGVPKAVGDLLGPCAFALMMGVGRLAFGIFGERLVLEKWLMLSGALGIFSYLLTALAAAPILSLIGCMLTGFAAALLWPGTYSLGSGAMGGSTAMFAMFALAGDVGCASGPAVVAFFSEQAKNFPSLLALLPSSGGNSSLRMGILFASIPCFLLFISTLFLWIFRKKRKLRKKNTDF